MAVNPLEDVAVIIPLAPQEEAWTSLLPDLRDLPLKSEIILVSPEAAPLELKSFETDLRLAGRVRWVHSKPGRALQLNAGAKVTKKPFLWFLHADSQLTPRSIVALRRGLERAPGALHYFNLRFLPDGPPLMRVNEVGCWVRSRLMGVPFGDQGFCIARKNFEAIGGFPEGSSYGEDHLFIWRARQKGVTLRCTGEALLTSARRYQENGWLQLTWSYAHRWVRQAVPEWFRLWGVHS